MESNMRGDNTILSHVDIHCSLNQVSWANLNVSQISEPQIVISEIETQTASIRMSYRVQTIEGKKRDEYNEVILCLVHIQDLDIMVVIVAPRIIPVIKAEKVRQLFVRSMITKQLVLQQGSFQVSDTNRMLVWQNSADAYDCTKLILTDLNTGETQEIEPSIP